MLLNKPASVQDWTEAGFSLRIFIFAAVVHVAIHVRDGYTRVVLFRETRNERPAVTRKKPGPRAISLR